MPQGKIFPSYRNQSSYLLRESTDRFLHDGNTVYYRLQELQISYNSATMITFIEFLWSVLFTEEYLEMFLRKLLKAFSFQPLHIFPTTLHLMFDRVLQYENRLTLQR